MIVAAAPAKSGPPRVLIEFGTGIATPITHTEPGDLRRRGTGPLWRLGLEHGRRGRLERKGSSQYASLSAPRVFSAANLQAQTITTTGTTRAITNTPVCWQGSTDCSGGNNQYGWAVTLPGKAEQIVYSPSLEVGLFIVNTLIPATNSPLQCSSSLPSGFTMAISPTTGGSFTNSVFADPSTGSFKTKNINGMLWSGTGSGSIVTSGGQGVLGINTFFITQTVAGMPLPPQKINPPGGTQGGRLTWVQRR